MSLRTKVLTLVEIVLRVPPLFIIDEILKVSIVPPGFTEQDLSGFEQSFDDNASHPAPALQYHQNFYRLMLAVFIRFMFYMCGKFSNQRKFQLTPLVIVAFFIDNVQGKQPNKTTQKPSFRNCLFLNHDVVEKPIGVMWGKNETFQENFSFCYQKSVISQICPYIQLFYHKFTIYNQRF